MAADTSYHKSILPIVPPQRMNDGTLHFPYPIIFVHGLSGSADTWVKHYTSATAAGWSYGGQLRYHLNMDLDHEHANISTSEQNEVFKFHEDPEAADYYLINFNVSTAGEPLGEEPNYYLSNQAAITKQGMAIADAVRTVLKACGVEKVILFGHSMGGLAIRQYLQNPELWPTPEGHHVAKFISSGTPHGGSNMSGGPLVDFFRTDSDEQSDAVRDLRESYSTGKAGVFLFGGVETDRDIDNSIWNDYYNVDVNCNGVVGERIVGLNEKAIDEGMAYAVIYGTAENDVIGRPGDGVVNHWSSQLKNFYPNITSETFHHHTEGKEDWSVHGDLPDQVLLNMQALDEPDFGDNAYEIETNRTYNGYISKQAQDGLYVDDYDPYIFELTEPQAVQIYIEGVGGIDPKYALIDIATDAVLKEGSLVENVAISERVYEAGQYLLDIVSTPTDDSWTSSYAFHVSTRAPDITSTTAEANMAVSISPNPAHSSITLSGIGHARGTSYSIFDLSGRRMISAIATSNTIDVSFLRSGLYQVVFDNQFTGKFMKR